MHKQNVVSLQIGCLETLASTYLWAIILEIQTYELKKYGWSIVSVKLFRTVVNKAKIIRIRLLPINNNNTSGFPDYDFS